MKEKLPAIKVSPQFPPRIFSWRIAKIPLRKLTSESGIFNPRVLLAFTLCSVAAFLALLSFAANPPPVPGWSIATSPSVASYTFLNKVTCASASDCWAVGYNNNQTLIEHWDGTSWSIVTSPDTAPGSTFNGVTCASASDCWAVGRSAQNDTGEFSQTLIEHWDGTSWSIVTSPDPAGTASVLSGVTCTSASDCWALGSSGDGTIYNAQSLIEHWDGTSWSIVTSPNASGAARTDFGGVTCTSASDCWTVGASSTPDGDSPTASDFQPQIAHWDGTSWSIVTPPTPGDINPWGFNVLNTVTCTSASDCWAVGTYNNGYFSLQTLIEHWDGTSWSIVTSPNNGIGSYPYNQLGGVTCTSASDCWALGSSRTLRVGLNLYPRTLIEHWDGTSWSIVASPNSGNLSHLASITCTPDLHCWAVGWYGYTFNDAQPLIAEYAPNTPASPNPETVNIGTVESAVIALTFPQVTVAGTTTAAPIDPSLAGTLPSAYELTGDNPPLAFEITTTAIYPTPSPSPSPQPPSPPIIIAFQVSVDPMIFPQLRVLHNEGGTLVDRTATDPAPDPTTQTIYASVSSLSPFVIAKLTITLSAQVQQPINADGTSVFSVRRGVVPVKFTLTQGGVGTCTLPTATIAVTRTSGGTIGAVDELVYSGSADTGSNFRIDSCQYVYNLSASALGRGTYRVDIKINGQVVGSATFQLK